MKIAITGQSAGIGYALSTIYESLGNEVVGISKRHGDNIRNISKIAGMIEPCDVFINNAQDGFAQTELLFEVAKRWANTNKTIIVISTMMTQQIVAPMHEVSMDQYRVQKISLEESVKLLRRRRSGIKLIIVRPGNISTSTDKTVPPAADVTNWALTLVNILDLANKNNLEIPDISLGPVE